MAEPPHDDASPPPTPRPLPRRLHWVVLALGLGLMAGVVWLQQYSWSGPLGGPSWLGPVISFGYPLSIALTVAGLVGWILTRALEVVWQPPPPPVDVELLPAPPQVPTVPAPQAASAPQGPPPSPPIDGTRPDASPVPQRATDAVDDHARWRR